MRKSSASDSRAERSPRQNSSLRQAQRQLTHQRLLAAAEREIYRRGYALTTVDDIAVGAGATRGTFYLHFNTKADVIVELVAQAESEFHPLWELLREMPPAPDHARLRSWLEILTRAWRSSRERTHVIFDAVHAEPSLEGLREQWREQDLDLLVGALKHMTWESERHARIECMLLLAELERSFEFWNSDHDRGMDELLLDVLANRWCQALNRDRSRAVRGVTAGRGRGRRG